MVSPSVYHAIADPTRREILSLLATGGRSVEELGKPFAVSQPAVSQHLRVLLDAGLVSRHKAGRRRIYQISAEPLREVFDWLAFFERFWDSRFEALGAYLDKNKSFSKPGRKHRK